MYVIWTRCALDITPGDFSVLPVLRVDLEAYAPPWYCCAGCWAPAVLWWLSCCVDVFWFTWARYWEINLLLGCLAYLPEFETA